jgi:lipid-binding SYLF domain-containing protein
MRVNPENVPIHGITFREAVLVWAKVAALSFGDPAGQIAVMHRIVVEERAGAERFSRSQKPSLGTRRACAAGRLSLVAQGVSTASSRTRSRVH